MDVSAQRALPHGKRLVLFDGYCHLCTGAVQFILKRDPHERFYFSALSSQPAQKFIDEHPRFADSDSLLLYHCGRMYDRSSAVLRIAKGLNGLWPVFGVFLILPKPLRDAIYSWISRNRYRWFGKRDTCMIPDKDYSYRFLQ